MRILIGVGAAVLAVVAIGCGSGSTTTEVAMTKAQFIKRADEICRNAQKKKEKAIVAWTEREEGRGKGELGDYTPEELGQVYVDVAVPPVKKASDELAALEAPTEDAAIEKFVDSVAATVRAIEEEPTLGNKAYPYEGPDKLARAYGFKVCDLL